MSTYRQKRTVQAVRFEHSEVGADSSEQPRQLKFNEEPPAWLTDAMNAGKIKALELGEDYLYLQVGDNTDGISVNWQLAPGDWVVLSDDGELYGWETGKIGDFLDTYEPVA